jgi:leucyl-tRNA synthetase
LKVFTTRPDTIFGATFLAISTDHPFCKDFENQPKFLEFKKKMFTSRNNRRGNCQCGKNRL